MANRTYWVHPTVCSKIHQTCKRRFLHTKIVSFPDVPSNSTLPPYVLLPARDVLSNHRHPKRCNLFYRMIGSDKRQFLGCCQYQLRIPINTFHACHRLVFSVGCLSESHTFFRPIGACTSDIQAENFISACQVFNPPECSSPNRPDTKGNQLKIL